MSPEALALLRAALGQRATRTRPKRAPRPRAPRAAERAYERDLTALTRTLTREVAKVLAPFLASARAAERRDVEGIDPGAFGADLFQLRARLRFLVAERSGPLTAKASAQIASANAAELGRVLSLSFADEAPNVTALLARFRQTNVELITSIPERMLDDVGRLVTEATTTGMRVETLASRLKERFAISTRRAALIARDQTLKINAQLTSVRHQEAGITSYVWSTSRDERVREMHQDLEGRVLSWADPPVTNENGDTNHPGEDFQCRCVAVAIIPS